MCIEKLTPAFKDYLWGGTKLRDVYKKPCSYDKIAESWELSTHPAGECRIAEGPFAGMTLSRYFTQAGPEVLGSHGAAFENFPVLIKFIDAKDPLSVQVHPSDEYALRVEGEYGKTEMWYVIDCEPGAALYFGVNRPVAREELEKRIADNTVEKILNRVDVHPGDVFFIEAGTLHAIGAGILICEIQQNSNCTYRVYDYDRRDAAGNPRELHVAKALEVARLTPSPASGPQAEARAIPGGSRKPLASCRYFTVEKYTAEDTIELEAGPESFLSLTVLEGSGTAAGPENSVDFQPGDSLFVPAGTGKISIQGPCSLLQTTV